ncbi:MAG: cytochrome c biogenesis protein CcsA, partial [Sphingomonadaceae bacterium]
MDASRWHDLANPRRFQKLAGAVLPWLLAAALAFLAVGLGMGLFVSPQDYLQGESVRIMYVHVPTAWLALGAYLGMAVAALAARIWRHPLADLAVRAIAPVGAVFALVCLVTGSLW